MRERAGVGLDKMAVRAVQGVHFVFSNSALGGYNRGVLTKAKTNLIMITDLRDGPMRCGMPEPRSATNRLQEVAVIRAGRPSRTGGVAE